MLNCYTLIIVIKKKTAQKEIMCSDGDWWFSFIKKGKIIKDQTKLNN